VADLGIDAVLVLLVASAVGCAAPTGSSVVASPSVEASTAPPAASAADTVTLRFAVSDDRDRPSQNAVDTFVDEVSTRSSGSIVVTPTFDAGSATTEKGEVGVAGMVQRGTADLGLVGSRAWDLAGVTSLQVLQAPFLITDDELATQVAQSEVATQAMDGLADIGVTGLALWPEDLRHPFSFKLDEPLVSPSDFEGATILVQPSALSRALIEALGGIVYSGDDRESDVAAGLLHGAESGLQQGASLPGKPTATGNVVFYPKFQTLVANSEAFDALTDGQRDILRAAAEATQEHAITTRPTEPDAAAEWCAAGGSIVHSTAKQVAAFEAAAKPILDQVVAAAGAAALIDEIVAIKARTDASPPPEPCKPG
jgi:C4-dicarboxylate-binding protein DctP